MSGPDYDQLNRQFYSFDPAAYFTTKLNLLMQTAARGTEIYSGFDGIEFDGLRITDDVGVEIPNERLQAFHSAYITTEIAALRHHAGEALLRLFLAHAANPPCPWLEVASLTNFAIFKERVEDVSKATDSTYGELVRHVFAGGSDSFDAAAAHAAVRLLQITARNVLEDAHLYNAIKHGIAVVPGRAAISITDDQTGQSMLGADGPSVVFLESERDGSTRKWSETTRWLSLRQNIWFTHLVIRQMDALWSIAGARYLGNDIDGVHIVTDEAISLAVTGAIADPQSNTRFRRTVAVQSAGKAKQGKRSGPKRRK